MDARQVAPGPPLAGARRTPEIGAGRSRSPAPPGLSAGAGSLRRDRSDGGGRDRNRRGDAAVLPV